MALTRRQALTMLFLTVVARLMGTPAPIDQRKAPPALPPFPQPPRQPVTPLPPVPSVPIDDPAVVDVSAHPTPVTVDLAAFTEWRVTWHGETIVVTSQELFDALKQK